MSSSPASAPQRPSAAAFFDARADQYEKTTGTCTRELAIGLTKLPHLDGAWSADAVLLDNACGTAIVCEEVVKHCRKTGKDTPLIHAVDPAPRLVAIGEKKLALLGAEGRCHTGVMSGEKLAFQDETFTHSVTNLGILFFDDSAAGAREIYRTLRPGGVAVVTSWSDLGYLDGVIRPAQKAVKPDDPPFSLPIPPAWFTPEHMERCMREDAGFGTVEMQSLKIHYGAATKEEVGEMLRALFVDLFKDWDVGAQEKFKAVMTERIDVVAENYNLPSGESGFGIPMRAIIAICQK